MIRALILALLPAAVPAAVPAASFTPPAGCTTTMTVQSKECRVSNHYVCTGDAPNTAWRVDAGQTGPYFMTQTDTEGEWLQSRDAEGMQVLGKRNDPASITTLYETGRDSYDFWLEHDDRAPTHVTGYDTLTGKDHVIDGQTLQETEFEFTETDGDGTVLRRARGHEFVSRELGSFFAGPSEYGDADGEWLPSDSRPMSFAFPGEKGFEASQPIFDCDTVLS
ncbi:hypothetical protein [Falsirhodobacter algicola]|uniref:Uncharacterized protein n=1 Tax=Falsirhodobacter algicola TaxID=2692330 RepID=A0A8J8MTE1_9RHOB|nr:hypothetical protein [Falsirhodobacter algicola]QUS36124.1 hypothetical protein GR316_07485 [Falsirhodobacter algicola]